MRRAIAAVVALAVAAVGGTWVYLNVIRDDAPERLSVDGAPRVQTDAGPTSAATGAPREGIEGRWAVSDGSEVGYRVKEVIFGQSTEGVGRTSDVTGEIFIEGTSVEEADFEADLRTLKSDEERRDDQVQTRILDTANHPTAAFTTGGATIDLGEVPDVDEVVRTTATGELTVRGTTKKVSFEVEAKRTADTIQISGAIPIVFADYGIPNPSNFVAATEDRGLLEFLLVLRPAS